MIREEGFHLESTMMNKGNGDSCRILKHSRVKRMRFQMSETAINACSESGENVRNLSNNDRGV